MILSRRVMYNGRQLDEIDESIVIRSVVPTTPKETIEAASIMGGVGQRVTASHWETTEVEVVFAIDLPKTELTHRKEIFDKVISWALNRDNQRLVVNFIPGRMLVVDKVVLPQNVDLWNWTGDYAITFRAYNVPFWQDINPVYGIGAGSDIEIPLTIPGQVKTVVDFMYENQSGQVVNNLTVRTGSGKLKFSGLNLGGTETLIVDHVGGLLRAYIGGRSVLDNIAVTSSDDLYINPGTKSDGVTPSDKRVFCTADRYGRWTVQVVGRYL